MAKEIERKSFIFFTDWMDALKESDTEVEVIMEVLFGINEYVKTGEVPELKRMAKQAFFLIKKDIDRNNEKYQSISKKRSESAKKGGGNPNLKKGEPNPYYQHIEEAEDVNKHKQTQTNINKHKLNDNNNDNENVNDNKKEEDKHTCYSFDEFWKDYDKKLNLKDCKRKYEKISEANRALIKKHIPLYKESTKDKQYRKHPQTYLNGECWNDEVMVSIGNGKFTSVSVCDANDNEQQVGLSLHNDNQKEKGGKKWQ